MLNKIIHYQDFDRAFVQQPEGDQVRYDSVYLRSRRTEPAWVINLESYFDHVRRIAFDEVFVGCYLSHRYAAAKVVCQHDKDFDQHLLSEVVDRMYDSFALLGKLVRRRTLHVPSHRVINRNLQVHGGGHLLPGPVMEHVPYGQMFAEYETADGAARHRIGRSEVYMVAVLRHPTDAPNGEHVFFKLTDLPTMFQDLRQRIKT